MIGRCAVTSGGQFHSDSSLRTTHHALGGACSVAPLGAEQQAETEDVVVTALIHEHGLATGKEPSPLTAQCMHKVILTASSGVPMHRAPCPLGVIHPQSCCSLTVARRMAASHSARVSPYAWDSTSPARIMSSMAIGGACGGTKMQTGTGATTGSGIHSQWQHALNKALVDLSMKTLCANCWLYGGKSGAYRDLCALLASLSHSPTTMNSLQGLPAAKLRTHALAAAGSTAH